MGKSYSLAGKFECKEDELNLQSNLEVFQDGKLRCGKIAS